MLDAVDRLARHHAQRLGRIRHAVGNLSHALKTPLAVLQHRADELAQAGSSDAARAVQGQIDIMRNTIERELRRARFMAVAEEVSVARLQRRVGQTLQVLVDKASALGKKGGVGRSYADAPEIDGLVHLLPTDKASRQYKVGDFVKARVVEAQGHDLVAQIL